MATPENMLTNPGFEDDFLAWQVWTPDPTTGQIVVDTVDFFSGTKSAKFTMNGGRGSIGQSISKDRLVAGAKYKVRLVYKSDFTVGGLAVYVYFRATDGTVMRYERIMLSPSAAWTQTDWLEATAPIGDEWNTFASFQIMITTGTGVTGSANIDDVEFVPVTVVTITFQSTPIAVTATLDGTTVPSGQAVQVQQGAIVTVTVPQEVAA